MATWQSDSFSWLVSNTDLLFKSISTWKWACWEKIEQNWTEREFNSESERHHALEVCSRLMAIDLFYDILFYTVFLYLPRAARCPLSSRPTHTQNPSAKHPQNSQGLIGARPHPASHYLNTKPINQYRWSAKTWVKSTIWNSWIMNCNDTLGPNCIQNSHTLHWKKLARTRHSNNVHTKALFWHDSFIRVIYRCNQIVSCLVHDKPALRLTGNLPRVYPTFYSTSAGISASFPLRHWQISSVDNEWLVGQLDGWGDRQTDRQIRLDR